MNSTWNKAGTEQDLARGLQADWAWGDQTDDTIIYTASRAPLRSDEAEEKCGVVRRGTRFVAE